MTELDAVAMAEQAADKRVAIVQAARLGLALPDAAIAGVVANLALLAEHHAVLRDALGAWDASA